MSTFGKIWVTDGLSQKRLCTGDYVTLRIIEVDSKLEHHIKYTFVEGAQGGRWIEENWYEIEPS